MFSSSTLEHSLYSTPQLLTQACSRSYFGAFCADLARAALEAHQATGSFPLQCSNPENGLKSS